MGASGLRAVLPSLRRVLVLAALAITASAMTARGQERGAAPLPVACPAGALVDAGLRDAALRQLRALAVHAPGQPAHGALRRSLAAAHVDAQGRAWQHVAAYEGNLGLAGALRVDPALTDLSAAWLAWQMAVLPVQGPLTGQLPDHWVLADGTRISPCPPDIAARHCGQLDATDSTLASFFLLAQAHVRAGGDAQVLRSGAARLAFDAAVRTLATLDRGDGLSWAKPEHREAYLMDAVEVAAGWRALAWLQAQVWAEPAAARLSLERAARTWAAVQAQLWEPRTRLWRVSAGAGAPRLAQWYPDTVAQAWPLLWAPPEVDADTLARLRGAWQRAAGAWQTRERAWHQRTVDPAGFWWPAAAVAAHCAGDTARALDWLARARRAWLAPAQPFAWPFQVADLLWLLWLAEPLGETAPAATPTEFPNPSPTRGTP